MIKIRYMHEGAWRKVYADVLPTGELKMIGSSVIDHAGIADAVAGVTKAAGIKPCGACKKRQAALNKATPQWVTKVLGWFRT